MRDIKKPFKRKEMRIYLAKNKITITGILETRVKENKCKACINNIAKGWDYAHNYTEAENGRIWILWNAAEVNLVVLEAHDQYMHLKVIDKGSDFWCVMTVVYAKNTIEDRRRLWKNLVQIGTNITDPWCLCGDFNIPLNCTDRIGGQQVTDSETRDCQHVMDILNLFNMKAVGRIYTWSNGHVRSKIDRDLCNSTWMTKFGTITAQFKENAFSDHTPIHIEHLSRGVRHHKSFKFLNVLANHDRFLQTVETIWTRAMQGGGMYKVWLKLKMCKAPLKVLFKNEMGSLDRRILEDKNTIEDVQKMIIQAMSNSVEPSLMTKEKETITELQKWSSLQEQVYKHKSKAYWLEVGDGNNKYFFAHWKIRASCNNISVLTSLDGRNLLKHEEIETEILQFYKNLLGSSANILPSIDVNIM